MGNLNDVALSLFADGRVQQIVGFEKGKTHPRPFFCKSADEAGRLVLDGDCRNNLAVYITKPELTSGLKTAFTATARILKSIVQLGRENQVQDGRFLFIAGETAEECSLVETLEEAANYVENHPASTEPAVEERLKEMKNWSREERWQFWKAELGKCIRCYACRAACPLCYCNRCVVEVNCPQWIDPWPAPLSNIEWQVNRVMHMAGRCTDCGACEETCPLDLPIHLLTRQLFDEVHDDFGEDTGGNALSTFNPADKETFFK